MPGFDAFNKYSNQKSADEPTTLHTFKAGADNFEGTMSLIVM